MYIKNNNETLINNLPDDNFCGCEDYSIPEHERTAIDKVIEMYENGEFGENDFVEWHEVKERMRRLF